MHEKCARILCLASFIGIVTTMSVEGVGEVLRKQITSGVPEISGRGVAAKSNIMEGNIGVSIHKCM